MFALLREELPSGAGPPRAGPPGAGAKLPGPPPLPGDPAAGMPVKAPKEKKRDKKAKKEKKVLPGARALLAVWQRRACCFLTLWQPLTGYLTMQL